MRPARRHGCLLTPRRADRVPLEAEWYLTDIGVRLAPHADVLAAFQHDPGGAGTGTGRRRIKPTGLPPFARCGLFVMRRLSPDSSLYGARLM